MNFRENFKKDMKKCDHHIADLRKQLASRYAAVEKVGSWGAGPAGRGLCPRVVGWGWRWGGCASLQLRGGVWDGGHVQPLPSAAMEGLLWPQNGVVGAVIHSALPG